MLNILWTQEHQKHLSTQVNLIQYFRFFHVYLKIMHISHTWLNSQEIKIRKNHPESLILHISHKRSNTKHFFFLLNYPIYSLENLYDICYSMSTHTQLLFINQSNYCQNWIWLTLCQINLILTLDLVIVKKLVSSLISQAYLSFQQSVTSTHSVDQIKR